MPTDFFAVTSAGIAHILRLWALQEGLYIYIYLTYMYPVCFCTASCTALSQCYHMGSLCATREHLPVCKIQRYHFSSILSVSFTFTGKLKSELVRSMRVCTCACTWSITVRNWGALKFPLLAGQTLGDTEIFVLGRHSLTACAKSQARE